MEALFDGTGRVHAWLDDGGKIFGLNGKNLAFVDQDSVYGWNGRHLGWWQDGHIRDRHGRVSLFASGATNLGVVMPVQRVRPIQPVKQISPIKPVKSIKPVRSIDQLAWSKDMPF